MATTQTNDDTDHNALWEEIAAERKNASAPSDPHDETPDDEPAEKNEADNADDGDDGDEKPAGEDDGHDDEDDVDEGGKKPDDPKEDPAEQIKRLQHAIKSDRGRYKADQRQIRELRARLADYEAGKAKDDDAARERREKIERAREDYPDVVGPIADRLDDFDKQTEERQKRAQDADEQEFARVTAAQQALFEKEHPDGFDVIAANPAEFQAWLDDQPRAVRDAFEDNRTAITDGIAAAHLVGLFKQSRAAPTLPDEDREDPTSVRRRRQLNGAQAHRSRTTSRAPSAPSRESTGPDQWEYVKQLRARRNKE